MTALALTPKGVKKPLLSNVFEEWFGNDFLNGPNINWPKTNIQETDDHYLIELSVPGYQKKDFKIEVDHQFLSVSSSVDNLQQNQKNRFTIKGFTPEKFSKSFSLSENIDPEMISAKYDNGILSINLPKKEEERSKHIQTVEIK